MQYGFQKHLTSHFPSQITIDVTQYCNLACIHCPHSNFAKSPSFSGAHLDEEVHKKFINEVASDGYGYCEYLRYTANGETLIHPKIDKLLDYACKYSKTKVNVTTNGMLLNAKNRAMLLECGVNVIDISLDAFNNETYAKIRVKGDLKLVRENILALLKQREVEKSHLKLVVSFVEQPLNCNETQDFKAFWESVGADFVVIRRLHSAGGFKEAIRDKMLNAFAGIQRKPCIYPWERLLLMPTGELGFCPTDWAHQGVLGDLRKVSIKEVWQGEKMQALRKAHLENNFKDFAFCSQCPDWIHTRWPQENGRNYADMMREIVPEDLL